MNAIVCESCGKTILLGNKWDGCWGCPDGVACITYRDSEGEHGADVCTDCMDKLLCSLMPLRREADHAQ